jgi:acylphosphatase
MAVVVAAAFALALVPQIRIAAPVFRRSSPLVLGGFQQKEAPALVAGSRVSLVFSGGSASKLQEAACDGGNCDPGLTGVIYSLPSGRIEIIAEGPQDTITAFVKRVRDAAVGAQVKESTQLPVGAYMASFPLINLAQPSATAKIIMSGPEADMDYIARHLNTEAVFNRGLKLTKEPSTSPEQLSVVCSGKSERLKSFVRWCYLGPPLARPEKVQVQWAS